MLAISHVHLFQYSWTECRSLFQVLGVERGTDRQNSLPTSSRPSWAFLRARIMLDLHTSHTQSPRQIRTHLYRCTQTHKHTPKPLKSQLDRCECVLKVGHTFLRSSPGSSSGVISTCPSAQVQYTWTHVHSPETLFPPGDVA